MNFYEFSILISENTVTQWLKQNADRYTADYYKHWLNYVQAEIAGILHTNDVKITLPIAKWVIYNAIKQARQPKERMVGYRQIAVDAESHAENLIDYVKEEMDAILEGLHGNRFGVADYLNAKLDKDNIDYDPSILSKFNSLDYHGGNLAEDSHHWHEIIKDRRVKSDEPGRSLIKFPDGWQWVSLDKDYCSKEAKAMGHCGNVMRKSGDNILSLRDPEGWSHLTFIVNNERLGESKGPKNSKWSDYDVKLKPYIIKLLESPYVQFISGGGYKPEANFYLADLDPKEREELLKKKPQLDNLFILALKTNLGDPPWPKEELTRAIKKYAYSSINSRAAFESIKQADFSIKDDYLVIDNFTNLVKDVIKSSGKYYMPKLWEVINKVPLHEILDDPRSLFNALKNNFTYDFAETIYKALFKFISAAKSGKKPYNGEKIKILMKKADQMVLKDMAEMEFEAPKGNRHRYENPFETFMFGWDYAQGNPNDFDAREVKVSPEKDRIKIPLEEFKFPNTSSTSDGMDLAVSVIIRNLKHIFPYQSRYNPNRDKLQDNFAKYFTKLVENYLK